MLRYLLMLVIMFCWLEAANGEPIISSKDIAQSEFITSSGERFGALIVETPEYSAFEFADTAARSFCPSEGVSPTAHMMISIKNPYFELSEDSLVSIAKQMRAVYKANCPKTPRVHTLHAQFFLDRFMFNGSGRLSTVEGRGQQHQKDRPLVTLTILYNGRRARSTGIKGMYTGKQYLGSGSATMETMISKEENQRLLRSEITANKQAIARAEREAQEEIELQKRRAQRSQMLAQSRSEPQSITVDGVQFQRSKAGASNLYIHTINDRSGLPSVSITEMFDFVDRNHKSRPILIDYSYNMSYASTRDYAKCDLMNMDIGYATFRSTGYERPLLVFDTRFVSRDTLRQFNDFMISASKVSRNLRPTAKGRYTSPSDFQNGGFQIDESSFLIGYAPDGTQIPISTWGDKNDISLELAEALSERSYVGRQIVSQNQGVLSEGVTVTRRTGFDQYPEYSMLKFYSGLLVFYSKWGFSGRPSQNALAPYLYATDGEENTLERYFGALGASKTQCYGVRGGLINERKADEIRLREERLRQESIQNFMSLFEGQACATDTVLEIYGAANPCWGE